MEQHSFGYWLRLKRKALDLTREGLAKRLGYSAETVRKIETEERRPSAQIAERLAEILQIPENERKDFLRFARGDWKSAPSKNIEESPWHLSPRSTRSNIPATTTSLIAREKEIALILEYLSKDDIRLVTLIGPPGIGKTRLSIEAARASLSGFPDGVFFVVLAPLDDPTLIATTIAQALGYLGAKNISTTEQLKEGIGEKQMLIVLDNCEHLIEDVASLASFLLSACSRLKILATSRESLRIPGEWLYPVPGFDVPLESAAINMATASKFPALTLFAERARAVRSDFALNTENIKTVSAICARLDGLPLVIELIAARIRLMSPQALLERLNDQFILSADGMRAASTRQKTLNSAISWSYKLLSPEEQKLFAYLSVFSGGFSLGAAESIFSRSFTGKSVSDLITSLLDKSLIQHDSDREAGGEPRYTMLVTIQEFARDRLRDMGDEPNARNRHLSYFRGLAEQARPHLRSSQQVVWLDRLETEHDNIRAALIWAQGSGAIAAGLHLVTDLEMFWIYRAYLREACLTLENLLAKSLPDDNIQTLARGHLVAGLLQMFLGNLAVGHAHAQESERLCLQLGSASKVELADSRNLLIYTDVNIINNPIRMRQGHEENLKLFQEAGDSWMIAHTLYNIGEALRLSGDFAGARQTHEQSLALFQACGDNIRVAQQKASLAFIAFEEGKYAVARTNFEEALSFYHQARFNLEIDNVLYMLGTIAIHEEDYAHAKIRYSECLLFYQRFGRHNQFPECLIGFARIANVEEHFEHAAQLLGAAGMEVEARQIPLWNVDRAEFDRNIQIARDQIGESAFEALISKGRAMTTEQAIVYALGTEL